MHYCWSSMRSHYWICPAAVWSFYFLPGPPRPLQTVCHFFCWSLKTILGLLALNKPSTFTDHVFQMSLHPSCQGTVICMILNVQCSKLGVRPCQQWQIDHELMLLLYNSSIKVTISSCFVKPHAEEIITHFSLNFKYLYIREEQVLSQVIGSYGLYEFG